MNLLMADMLPTMHVLMPLIDGGSDPLTGGFWFIMSIALIVGLIPVYPINWLLFAYGLKYSIITYPPQEPSHLHPGAKHGEEEMAERTSIVAKAGRTVLTIVLFALSIATINWLSHQGAL